MRKGRITLAAGGLATFTTVVTALSVGATGGGGPVAVGVLGSGSDTTETVMAYLDYGYNIGGGFGYHTAGGCQQLATSPTPQWLDFSCADSTKGDIDRTVSDGVTTAGSTTITSATAAFDCGTGCPVTLQSSRDLGRGVTSTVVGLIPAGDYINKVDSPTMAELAVPAAITGSSENLNINRIVTDNYRHDQVHGAFFLGSSVGISQLCSQGSPTTAAIDYARSSRAAAGGDCSGLHFVAYARDAISWEAFNIAGSGVNTQNNLSAPCAGGICLTQAQLKAIYVGCTITNWNQVGGPNLTISIYTAQSGSGTRKTWDTFLGGSSSTCTTVGKVIPENSNGGIPVADDKGAIFPFSVGVWNTTVAGAGGAVLGQVDGIAPSGAHIQDGTFPYGRFLYNVFCGGGGATPCPVVATTATTDYVGEHGWICKNNSEHADAVNGANYRAVVESKITLAGFYPLTVGPIGGGAIGSDYCRLTVTP